MKGSTSLALIFLRTKARICFKINLLSESDDEDQTPKDKFQSPKETLIMHVMCMHVICAHLKLQMKMS